MPVNLTELIPELSFGGVLLWYMFHNTPKALEKWTESNTIMANMVNQLSNINQRVDRVDLKLDEGFTNVEKRIDKVTEEVKEVRSHETADKCLIKENL